MVAVLAPRQKNPRFNTLEQWLRWQKTLHPRKVDLGLDRVAQTLKNLQLEQPPFLVITVGGTNGKGSTVAFLEAILRAGGYRVGAYTSPYLLRYNEQIRINGEEVNDAVLCDAFADVDEARASISLSCFEFGTLAALKIFQQAAIEVAILEVGLGGRLDAVNALDADAAVVTTIAIDHVEWLGPDRNSIGYEKAGIYRGQRPAICADPDPPETLLKHARSIAADLYLYSDDYEFERGEQGWSWRCAERHLDFLPLPNLYGEHQLANAAAALMALHTLNERLPLTPDAIRLGLLRAAISGRFQRFTVDSGTASVEWILDIAHNPQGAGILADCLKRERLKPLSPGFSGKNNGRTFAIFGILRDKDVSGVIQALDAEINHWYTISLSGSRGVNAEQLAMQLQQAGIDDQRISICTTIENACQMVQTEAVTGDRIIVFGSSYTVSAVLQSGVIGGEVWQKRTNL